MTDLRSRVAFRNTVQKLTTDNAARSAEATSPPLFTARPRSTRWCVTAISTAGETVNLGDFPKRGAALAAARIMAQACGGRAVP
jgi:hypothetical protein